MSNEQYDYVPRYPDDRPATAAIVFLPIAILVLVLIVSTLHSIGDVVMNILLGWSW